MRAPDTQGRGAEGAGGGTGGFGGPADGCPACVPPRGAASTRARAASDPTDHRATFHVITAVAATSAIAPAMSTPRIERSSGFALLDQETLDTVQRASPVPVPPADVAGDPVEVMVPVAFYLRGR